MRSEASTALADAAAAVAARFGGAVDADPAARRGWSIGGVVPALVARPANAAAVAAMVQTVAAAGGALVPLGRGAHRHLGHPPTRYDVALVTDRLAAVRDYTPADMTVTVEAGATIADLAALLASEGQWLPLDPPLPAETTVGGLLAADLAGPLAGSQGRVRDFVIGLSAVTAEGVAARAGGRVVKNVAGYDLMKLFIGSCGTLGVLTEVTFKVRPRPQVERCLVFEARALAAALDFAAAIAAGQAPLAVTVTGAWGAAAAAATTIVRLGGVDADVAAARAVLLALAARHDTALVLDAEVADATATAHLERARDFGARVDGSLVVRLATLPARLPALVAALGDGLAGSCRVDPMRGVLIVAPTTDDPAAALARLAAAADAHGAHVVVERWPLALADTIAVWHPLPPALPLMRRMKTALDPHGVLAPGRFVGRA